MVISIPPSSWFLQLFRLGSCRHGTVALWVKCWVFAEGFIDGTMLVAQVGGCRFAFYWCGLRDSASSLTWSLVPCLGKWHRELYRERPKSWLKKHSSVIWSRPSRLQIHLFSCRLECIVNRLQGRWTLITALSVSLPVNASIMTLLLAIFSPSAGVRPDSRYVTKGPYILIEELRRQNRALFIWDNAAWNLTSQQFWLTSWIVLKAQGQNIKHGCLSLNWTWQWMPIRRNLEN